jgi:hypothetical protein
VPLVVAGHVALAPELVNWGAVCPPVTTWMGGAGENAKTFAGLIAKVTLAAAVPLLAIGMVNPLVVSAG